MYYYHDAVKEDIREYIENEIDLNEWRGRADELEEYLNDTLWCADSVTGNASGSYYCNAWRAEEAIAHNWDLLSAALDEFGGKEEAIERGAEWCDVTIRCYILGECIAAVMEEYAAALEEEEEEEEETIEL